MNWPYLLSLLLLLPALSYGLDYSDLESEGVSCPDRDSCQHMNHAIKVPIFENRSCECDHECPIYKDCCIDYARVAASRTPQISPLPCLPFGLMDNVGAFMVNKCRRDYTGSAEIRRQCEKSNNISDPLVKVPVTDAGKKITYSSRYCAECNNARPQDLSSWMIRVSCGSLIQIHNVSAEYVFSNLIYRAKSNQWGVNHRGDESVSPEFYVCDIIFDMPRYLMDDVRLCHHNVISACPPTWKRGVVKKKCESYKAVVYVRSKVYKNPHCALCNDVEMDAMTCTREIISRNKLPVSFALLLDVNRSDGDIVGMSEKSTPSCSFNQNYDPFRKKCRSLTCPLPGMSRVNGRCVRN